jgi:nicotinate-nucleotide adenylyltransferase
VERLGIFGGTFDPPHLGHMILAAEAADQLSLDRVLWMLSPAPPHKLHQRITPFNCRAELVRACIQHEPKFELSLIENERPGPHFTSDTLLCLREKFPNSTIVLLTGSDSMNDFYDWHEPQLILDRIDEMGVMNRPGDKIDWIHMESVFPNIMQKIRLIDAPLLEISSTEIRERIASNHHYRYYLNEEVFRMIETNHYYQKTQSFLETLKSDAE